MYRERGRVSNSPSLSDPASSGEAVPAVIQLLWSFGSEDYERL